MKSLQYIFIAIIALASAPRMHAAELMAVENPHAQQINEARTPHNTPDVTPRPDLAQAPSVAAPAPILPVMAAIAALPTDLPGAYTTDALSAAISSTSGSKAAIAVEAFELNLMSSRDRQVPRRSTGQNSQPATAATAHLTVTGKHVAQALSGSTPLVTPQASPTATPSTTTRRMIVLIGGAAQQFLHTQGARYKDVALTRALNRVPGAAAAAGITPDQATTFLAHLPSSTPSPTDSRSSSPALGMLAMAPPAPQAATGQAGWCHNCCTCSDCCNNTSISCCTFRSSTPVSRI